MSATKIRTSCFSPNFVAANSPQIPGLKRGPNGIGRLKRNVEQREKKSNNISTALFFNLLTRGSTRTIDIFTHFIWDTLGYWNLIIIFYH
ncbi:hypothetical protein L3X38_034080 [Prunus dulcis]|uniref:Uncharacterized protein n=1 Tax=Prunus dulcis TaxID=3755 RepID=A0AAD4VJL7_PRUDU|nr:hypothetical protein L3X38_034080 [Prunus dulcis]